MEYLTVCDSSSGVRVQLWTRPKTPKHTFWVWERGVPLYLVPVITSHPPDRATRKIPQWRVLSQLCKSFIQSEELATDRVDTRVVLGEKRFEIQKDFNNFTINK